MDYVTMIEQYVREAWAAGKTTQEIKQELRAKRWPGEMVEVVIDRLVKQRVESKDGQLLEINGPDFWSEPTWKPPTKGWAGQTRKQVKQLMSAQKSVGEKLTWQVTKVPQQVQLEQPRESKETVEPQLAILLEPPSVAAKMVPKKMDEVVARMRAKNCAGEGKLVSKIARIKREQAKLEEKQSQAMILIFVLFGVIILAVLWRVFVIK